MDSITFKGKTLTADNIVDIPNTNLQTYIPQGEDFKMNWNDAMDFAKTLNNKEFLGKNKWRVPNLSEIGKIYENKVKVNCSNKWYWSSYEFDDNARGLNFNDANWDGINKDYPLSVRCVCSS